MSLQMGFMPDIYYCSQHLIHVYTKAMRGTLLRIYLRTYDGIDNVNW